LHVVNPAISTVFGGFGIEERLGRVSPVSRPGHPADG